MRIGRTESADIPFAMESERAAENAAYVGRRSHKQHEGALTSADILHAVIWDAENHNVGFMILSGGKKIAQKPC